MIRRPPSSTLFPYTTLCRSSGRASSPTRRRATARRRISPPCSSSRRQVSSSCTCPTAPPRRPSRRRRAERSTRSEEHTSELQSRQYLVCRLLLEKNKRDLLHADYLNPPYPSIADAETERADA